MEESEETKAKIARQLNYSMTESHSQLPALRTITLPPKKPDPVRHHSRRTCVIKTCSTASLNCQYAFTGCTYPQKSSLDLGTVHTFSSTKADEDTQRHGKHLTAHAQVAVLHTPHAKSKWRIKMVAINLRFSCALNSKSWKCQNKPWDFFKN